MINAKIIVSQNNNFLFWFAELSTIIKEKEYKKEFKDFSSSQEYLEPIEILFSAIKTKSEITIKTNDKNIEEILSNYKTEHSLTTLFEENLTYDFSEMIQFQEEESPFIPEYLTKIKEYETDFEKRLALSVKLFQNYLFFIENPEKVHETILIKKYKKEKLIPEDVFIEDIFSIIEDTLSEGY